MKKLSLILASITLAGIAAAQDTTNMKFVGTGKGRNDIQIKFDGVKKNVFAGQLNHSFKGGVGSLAWLNDKTIATYCSEPTQVVSSSRIQYSRVDVPQLDPNVWSVNGQAKKNAIDQLMRTAYGTVTSAATTNTMAAAFQIAVWKIGYDFDGTAGSLDVNAGRFRAGMNNGSQLSGDLKAQVDTFLRSSVTTTNVSGLGNVIALHSDCNQDQLTAVPEPASMAALGIGIVGLMRRRRNQKKA